ncbi:zinc finger protein 782 [Musca vetustissima]|uniref:zinc finger protein 782 n=1 Tax=Musca vetustissima TaxID=27455 RepID=UPI002AB64DE6|nr:zinc finger protein 782 [Musca vetustissima]
MGDADYPNLESICRLCLKEDAGTVAIFPLPEVKLEKNSVHISIPMRIMSCAALEVQSHDGLPAKICPDCRLQLEKSYLFRKQSQTSDSKLRKHIRLLSLGKKSKVFKKSTDDDDDDDELEFQDSIDFIKQHEDKLKAEEEAKLQRFRDEMKLEQEAELEKCKETMKIKCREEVRREVEQVVRKELEQEMQKEMKEVLMPKIRNECMEKARESLREEVREECRENEMKNLLDDLQAFLKERQGTTETAKTNETTKSRRITINCQSSSVCNEEPAAKRPRYSNNKIQLIQMSDLDAKPVKVITANQMTNHQQLNGPVTTNIKTQSVLNDVAASADMDINVHGDEEDEEMDEENDCDSDNFFIYDTDEGFELQKKSSSKSQANDEDLILSQESAQTYDSADDNLVTLETQTPQKSLETMTTISYRIADSQNGEIKFLKKSTDIIENSVVNHNDEDNNDQLQNANIMILDYPTEDGEDEEHLELIDCGEDYNNKNMKPIILKTQTIKTTQPIEDENNIPSTINNAQHNVIASATVETTTTTTTLMSKTYSVQRQTDTPKTFKCNSCPMVFSTNASLERHLRTHRKGEETGVSFQCPECQVVVSCASALRRHMYVHCEEKPFICSECGRSFVQKEILKRHMQTHTGVKPYQCEHCDRSFAQRINLKQHINRHHTEEPQIQQYSCHLCPKRFNHASGLSRHLASHSGVAFQCSECDRTFGDRSSIKRHIANKHGGLKEPKLEKS